MHTQQHATQHPASVPIQHAPLPVRTLFTFKEAGSGLTPFTEPALRDQYFKSKDRVNSRGDVIRGNGSDEFGVWVSVGRKKLIDVTAHDRWCRSSSKRGAA